MNDTHPQNRPTSRQLRLLRSLADRTGGSFTYPRTSAEASAEIRRMQGRERTPAADRRRELRAVREDMASRRGDSASVRTDELAGYGSSAGWSGSVAES